MRKKREEAQAALRQANERMKESYDKHARPAIEYQPGDLVYLESTNIKTTRPSKKLGPKRFGPFKIVKKIRLAAYELELPPQWPGLRPVYNESYLTPHKPAHFPNQRKPEPPPPIEVQGEIEYVVEEIRDKQVRKVRGRPDKIQYLVHWKGYPNEEDTWEPIENLKNAQEAVDVFEGTTITFINRRVSHTDVETAELKWKNPKEFSLLFNEGCDAARQRGRLRKPLDSVDAVIPLTPEIVDRIQEEPWCSPIILPNLPATVRRIWIYETKPVNAVTAMIRLNKKHIPTLSIPQSPSTTRLPRKTQLSPPDSTSIRPTFSTLPAATIPTE